MNYHKISTLIIKKCNQLKGPYICKMVLWIGEWDAHRVPSNLLDSGLLILETVLQMLRF